MMWPSFVGPSYQTRSPIMDVEESINLRLESGTTQGNAKQNALLGTAGLRPLLTVATSGCRGNYTAEGRTWTVVGAVLYELNLTTNTSTVIGTVGNDGLPVSFSTNGRGGEQLALVSNGQLFILKLTTNVFTGPIVLPLTNAAVVLGFLDGYFLLLEKNTIRVWFSALEDGTTWDALDFFARSASGDNLVGMLVIGDRVWCFGTRTTNQFYDSGDANTPFLPYPGSLINIGAISAYAMLQQGGAAVWLAQDAQGSASVVEASGPSPTILSTPAVDFALGQYSTVNDCEVLGYELEGHSMLAFTFPTADVTWVFDQRESAWHKELDWDVPTGTYHRWVARGQCQANGQVIVGDVATGNLYAVDLNTFTVNGRVKRWVRRSPYLGTENQIVFIDAIEAGMQPGVGLSTGNGNAPTVTLALSKDFGQTWGPRLSRSVGAIGKTLNRAIWNRLGRARLDRLVIELSGMDPVRTAIGPGLWLRVTQGSGQL